MLFAALEKLTGMGIARIDQAMLGSVNDKATFVHTIRSLKAMEAALDHHRQNGLNPKPQPKTKPMQTAAQKK